MMRVLSSWLKTTPKITGYSFAFLFIFCVGIFLRATHFSEWLHFETDQVDDFFAVAPALEQGWGSLPLMGPKAAGTDLRLGPAFYMFEYLSAFIFGNTPAGHAGATLFFSLFSLPLFYLTAKIFFQRWTTLCLFALFATSPFLVLYGRFSWNPNVLPFFFLALVYTLIQAGVATTPRDIRFWLILSAGTLAVTMQLHVSAFFVAPALVGSFLLWRRPRWPLYSWALALLVFSAVFSPVLVYEVVSHGQMTQALTSKIDVPSEKNDSAMTTKMIQNFRYHAGNYFLIITGHDAVNAGRPDGASLGITCRSCKTEAPYRIAGYILYIIGFFLLSLLLFREKDETKKNFLLIVLLWFLFAFFFFFSIMLSGKYLYPRFFLLTTPVPIFFFGFLLQSINPEKNVVRAVLVLIFTLGVTGMNLVSLRETFSHMNSSSQLTTTVVEKEDIFPNTDRITLKQQEEVVQYIAERARATSEPLYLKSESEYEPSLWLLLEKRGIVFSGPTLSTDLVYEKGFYVMVSRSASSLTKEMKWYKEKFLVTEEIPFGSLTVSILHPKAEYVTQTKQAEKQLYQKKMEALDIPRWQSVGR